jgi:hypothetical protein
MFMHYIGGGIGHQLSAATAASTVDDMDADGRAQADADAVEAGDNDEMPPQDLDDDAVAVESNDVAQDASHGYSELEPDNDSDSGDSDGSEVGSSDKESDSDAECDAEDGDELEEDFGFGAL